MVTRIFGKRKKVHAVPELLIRSAGSGWGGGWLEDLAIYNRA